MPEDAPVEEVAVEAPAAADVQEPVANAAVQEALAAIAAEREAAFRAATEAATAEEKRVSDLVAAKARCAADCAPIADALAAATDPAERNALVELESRIHGSHAGDLEQAYLAFSGQRAGDSNPSGPEGALTSRVAVMGEASAA